MKLNSQSTVWMIDHHHMVKSLKKSPFLHNIGPVTVRQYTCLKLFHRLLKTLRRKDKTDDATER